MTRLDAGFNPEVTGRENTYLYSSLRGRTRRQTDEHYPPIQEFAGLGRFVDAPISTSSFGIEVHRASRG